MPDIIETTDAAGSAATAYNISLSDVVQGQVSSGGDHDFYRISLTAGQTYTVSLTGTGVDNLTDTFLRVYAANGTTQLASNDDGLPGLNSQLQFTATTSGNYYIDAAAYSSLQTGQYSLTVTAPGSLPDFDADMAAGVMDADASWSSTPGTGAVVTYGFRQTAATYTELGSDISTFTQLTSAEIAAVETALQFWSDVCGITFQRVNPSGYTDNAAMLFGNYSDNSDGAGAFAYFPGSTSPTASAGDVWLNNSVSQTSLPLGSYSFFAIMHEIGHAIGLSHPGLYNAAAGVNITYENNAQFIQDTQQYSVMSYFDEGSTGANYNSYADTPLLHDILSVQNIYGARTDTRSGDTVYGFNSTAGNSVFDFSANSTPALTIWDGGGTDALDLSGFSQTQFITLTSGAFSNVGGLTSNLTIAFGATIENAIGGSGVDTMFGNDANNMLSGGGSDDTLNGGLGNDTLDGGVGDDSLVGGLGDDIYYVDSYFDILSENAGEGNDTVRSNISYTLSSLNNVENIQLLGSADINGFGNASANVLEGNSGGNWLIGEASNDTLLGGLGRDTLHGGDDADTLVGDGALLPTDNAGSVYRLYLATLGRGPDPQGQINWTTALDAGTSITSIATGFINSTEFQSTYGALNNTQFVTLMYNNVLHRDPDASGLANWVNALNAGASRESVVIGFSESVEFQITSSTANDFGQVYRLYGAAFDRAPDVGGFDNWINALYDGTTLNTAADGFVTSAEFQLTYGALDNTAFVTLLYGNVLDRAPDAGGLAGWVGLLDGGASRASVLTGFSESQEYQVNTAGAFNTFMTTSMTEWQDTLVGGAGDDMMAGGRGNDVYSFLAGQGGSDQIFGFEGWDTLLFSGYGYADSAAAQSHLSVSGSDVLFSDQDQTITFLDTSLTTVQGATWTIA